MNVISLIIGIFAITFSLVYYVKFDEVLKGDSKYFSYESRKKMLKIGITIEFITGILIIIGGI